MKTIAIFSQNSGGGGAERVATLLANELSKENKIYYCSIKENGYYYLADGIEKIVFKGGALSQIKRIARFIKDKGVNAVLAIGSPVAVKIALSKKLYGLKFSFIASERNDPEREITSPIKRLLRKWAYGKADKVVFQTEAARSYYPEAIRKKGVIIFNPVLINDKTVVDVAGGFNRVIAAGRIDGQKNFTMLVKAFARFGKDHPEYRLDIFGAKNDEEEYSKVYAAIKENGLFDKVFLKGFSDDLYGEYLKSSVYVSSSDYEGISNSMLEALAAGLPCVCTDCPCGGAAATIDDGVNGLLVNVGDESALSNALKRLAESEELRKNLSRNAVGIREKFSAEKIAAEWKKLI